MPVQRIPRYNLLLDDLLKNTDDSHPDKESIAAALLVMKGVADHVNESIRKRENRQHIQSIQERIVNSKVDIE